MSNKKRNQTLLVFDHPNLDLTTKKKPAHNLDLTTQKKTTNYT